MARTASHPRGRVGYTDGREDGASNAPCESATRDKSQLDGVAFIAMELVGEGGFEPPTWRV